MSLSQLTNKEKQFVLQGLTALENETAAQKVISAKRLFPEDNNLQTLIEYYDKRAKELHDLKSKILGVLT